MNENKNKNSIKCLIIGYKWTMRAATRDPDKKEAPEKVEIYFLFIIT